MVEGCVAQMSETKQSAGDEVLDSGPTRRRDRPLLKITSVSLSKNSLGFICKISILGPPSRLLSLGNVLEGPIGVTHP